MEESSPDYGSINFQLSTYNSPSLHSPSLNAQSHHAYVQNNNLTFEDFDLDENRPPSPPHTEIDTTTSDRKAEIARRDDVALPEDAAQRIIRSFASASTSKPGVEDPRSITTYPENIGNQSVIPILTGRPVVEDRGSSSSVISTVPTTQVFIS